MFPNWANLYDLSDNLIAVTHRTAFRDSQPFHLWQHRCGPLPCDQRHLPTWPSIQQLHSSERADFSGDKQSRFSGMA